MYDLVINVFEQTLFTAFLFFLSKEHKKNVILYSVIRFSVSLALISYINLFTISDTLLTVVFIMIDYLYLRSISFFTRGNALMYAILPSAVIAVINTVADLSVMLLLFPNYSFYEILELYGIPFDMIIQLSHVIAFFLLCRFLRNNELQIPDKDWYISSVLLGLCMVMAICFQTVYLEYERSRYYLLLGIYCIVLFIIMILLLFKSLYMHIVQENRQKLEVTLLQNQMKSNEKIMEMRQEVNSMRHDMKHILKLLIDHPEGLNNEDIRKVTETYQFIDQSIVPIHTGFSAIDYVLNIKQEVAAQKRISFICSLNITKEIRMDSDDLFLLLSNLIDNAFVHIGLERTVRLIIKENDSRMMIQVRNSTDRRVIDENGQFIKNLNSDYHGYGLMTIRILVNKYQGDFIAYQDLDEVVCTVYLPVKP